MDRSLDALLDRSSPDRSSPDRGSLGRASLDRGAIPDGDPAQWQPVAQVLAALASAPESSELSGEARALAEFRAFAEFRALAQPPARGADRPAQPPRRGPGWMAWLPGGRPAVAAATGAVLMCGLLAVAYAGDLPVPAQRLAHNTIDAPAVRPDRDPLASSRPTVPPNSAGQAGPRATHASVVPDRRVHSGFASGHPHQHGSAGSPSGSSSGHPGSGHPGSGRQGQSGPGGSSEPVPTLEPSPSASISPPADATPSPSAAPSPSQSGPPHPQQSPSGPQSTPPDHPPPPVAAAGAVRRAGSQPPRGLGPSHIPSDESRAGQISTG
jgi:hypothetical protein